MKHIHYRLFLLLLLLYVASACSEDYLDKKPDKSLVVPTTLADFQALLDNSEVINQSPALAMMATDESFTTYSAWLNTYTATEKNTYIWSKEVYDGMLPPDWSNPYQQVFYANVVLDEIKKISLNTSNETQWNNIRGTALFIRAYAMFQLAELFTSPYNAATAGQDIGLPIRTAADVRPQGSRANQQEMYAQIASDLLESVNLLPQQVIKKTRPSIASAYAVLARLNLYMGNYADAEKYAQAGLAVNSYLIDFNSLALAAARTIPMMNNEVLFHSAMIQYSYNINSTTYVDTLLYAKYQANDLRKTAYFRLRSANRYSFKGNYTGSFTQFGGIANDEVYLILAEAKVRQGKTAAALDDLNTLLAKRWKQGTFIKVTESDSDKLLVLILEERQKELVFRGTYWSDRRRLNTDPKYARTMKRKLNGVEYTLPPGDNRFTFPIPQQEIQSSGMQQNP